MNKRISKKKINKPKKSKINDKTKSKVKNPKKSNIKFKCREAKKKARQNKKRIKSKRVIRNFWLSCAISFINLSIESIQFFSS